MRARNKTEIRAGKNINGLFLKKDLLFFAQQVSFQFWFESVCVCLCVTVCEKEKKEKVTIRSQFINQNQSFCYVLIVSSS